MTSSVPMTASAATIHCLLALVILIGGCAGRPADDPAPTESPTSTMPSPPSESSDDLATTPDGSESGLKLATFGAGCYWCVEAVFQRVEGVRTVRSGFMGGHEPNPTYEAVCAGITGHAEVVQLRFDPTVVSYDELLDWFWRLHDPTTLNRQGADIGTQYRSAIFYHDDSQREAAEASKRAAAPHFADPIVTEIVAAGPFYEAKASHQDYYESNKSAGYCRVVIRPKLKKLGIDD